MITTQRWLSLMALVAVLITGTIPTGQLAFADNDEIKIEVEIEDGITEIKVETADEKIEFELDTADEDEIIAAIMEKIDLSESQIRDIWEFEVRENDFDDELEEFEHDEENEVEIKVVIEDGVTYVGIWLEQELSEFELDITDIDEIVEIIIAETGLTFEEVDEALHIYYEDRDYDRPCIEFEEDGVAFYDEHCLLEEFDEIPHPECAEFEDGIVWFEDECLDEEMHPDVPHDGEVDQLVQRIHELEEENRNLLEYIEELEQRIDDLNELIMEQLRVIYEWILSR